MEDICNFLPKKKQSGEIEFIHFVYEASFRKLRQPFYMTRYQIFLTFKGTGCLILDGAEHILTPGTMFFAFPSQTFRLEGTSDFTYLYITFQGPGASPMLTSFGITPSRFLFYGHEQLLDFWMKSIRRVTPINATALTESVLLYSLSFIGEDEGSGREAARFDEILRYIQGNYTDPTLSIKKVADIHFYSEKYLSSLFMRTMNKRFTEYVNELRISHARNILRESSLSVSEAAARCGYSDPLYFSKVFKKLMGLTPSEYMKQNAL